MTAADSGRPRRGPIPHTAVVYFHGIGTPRRHEEISRLLDALDQLAQQQDYHSIGRLRGQEVRFEPSRTGSDDEVPFVAVRRVTLDRDDKPKAREHFRFYEVFWSPAVAGGISTAQVIAWTLTRLAYPLRTLLQPWRAHQSLKLATLYRLYADWPDGPKKRHVGQVESHYVEFESWPARRANPAGTFSQFREFARQKHLGNEAAQKGTLEAIDAWRRAFIWGQCKLLFVSITAVLALSGLLLAAWCVAAAAVASVWPGSLELLWPFYPLPRSWLSEASLALAGTLVFLALVSRFLSSVWSDVVFWASSEGKDTRYAKRAAILATAERSLRQVLADPNCRRVVVIGHSLGTAIAYEALLKLGRRRTAYEGHELPSDLAELEKISDFITMGSPIDHIHYFFEVKQSAYHRYNRVAESLISRPAREQKRRRARECSLMAIAPPQA